MTATLKSTEDSNDTRTWRALHAFCHRGKEATDRLLVDAVGPCARSLRERGLIDTWFFIRYWQGGPHVRVRLGGGRQAGLDEAAHVMREALLAHLRADDAPPEPIEPSGFYAAFDVTEAEIAEFGWHEDGVVLDAEYAPEIDRYGGDEAMPVAEDLFKVSSEVAVAVIANSPGYQARTGVALDLLLGFVRALFDNPAHGVAWLREYTVMWRYLDAVVADRSHQMRAAAETTFAGSADELTQRAGKLREDAAPALYRHWWQAVAGVAGWLREPHREPELTGPADAVMVSQLHMLANRLGLTASDEVYLAWLASFVLAAPGAPVGYFADSVHAPDRAYHELSKYRPSVFANQQPLAGEPVSRHLGFASGDPVDLPLPEQPALSAPLHEVISARRSTRGALAGTLDLDALAALLGYAGGIVGSDEVTVGGSPRTRGVRAHPSAGMAYPSVLRVAAFAVPGLRPALYEYLPGSHQLHQVGQLPAISALREASPFFSGEAPRIDVTAVPAVFLLGADLGGFRERYGLRAHRFAMLEIGHVAQTLLLLATALGLHATPVGGFYDDAACQIAHLDSYNEILGYLIPVGGPAQEESHEDTNNGTGGAER